MPTKLTPGMQQLYDLTAHDGNVASLGEAAFVEAVYRGGGTFGDSEPRVAVRAGRKPTLNFASTSWFDSERRERLNAEVRRRDPHLADWMRAHPDELDRWRKPQ